MKTIKFEVVIGIVAGYDASASYIRPEDAQKKVAQVWQEVAQFVFEKTGTYISANIRPTATVYSQEWGCPKGGEATAMVSGEANPAFIENIDSWKHAVRTVVKHVQNRLKQSTVALTFQEVENLFYMQRREYKTEDLPDLRNKYQAKEVYVIAALCDDVDETFIGIVDTFKLRDGQVTMTVVDRNGDPHQVPLEAVELA